MINRENIEINVVDLKPYEFNARTHDADQLDLICASIKEYGFTNPVIIDHENGLIAGHARALCAAKLGMATIPAVRLTGLSEAQKRALILMDNKSALGSGWDEDLLKLELAGIAAMGFNMDLTGFSGLEIGKIGGLGSAEVGEDELPEPPATPISVVGDIWQCGPHRVACGSSTDAHVVEALFAGATPKLMVTDPPYGVKYDPMWREGKDKGTTKNRRSGVVENDDRADWREAWALFPGNIAYVWHGGLHSGAVQESLESCGFAMRAQIIWAKQQFVFSRGDYHWQHEPCWYAVKGTGNWTGDRKQSTLWEIANLNKIGAGKIAAEDDHTNHSTQKPVECMRRPILNNTAPGESVYDPFLGSGSTLIAAETSSRVCYGCELNPVYVDTIVKRWEKLTGGRAVHAITGVKFTADTEVPAT